MKLIAIFFLVLFLGCSFSRISKLDQVSRNVASNPPPEMEQILRDLCKKEIALLGEASHGDGETFAFKAELARRLINDCHYNAFVIESGIYDFLGFNQKLQSGQVVTPEMVAAGIGGLWANQEVAPLNAFLFEKAEAGLVTLGGMDDQIGNGTYAQRELPSDLAAYLKGAEREQCLAELRKYTLWKYTEADPYNSRSLGKILKCLTRIERAVREAQPLDVSLREMQLEMTQNLKRFFGRELRILEANAGKPDLEAINDRDQSMFQNFERFRSKLPAQARVIVWSANVHIAKDLNRIGGNMKGRRPLGAHVRRAYGDQSFSLGFSAYSGSFAMSRAAVSQLSVAPPNSIEGLAFRAGEGSIRYLNSNRFRGLGEMQARPFGYVFLTGQWMDVFDGMVIFREERPPRFN